MENLVQIHVIISGRVQGVFYRASTKTQADHLRLKGWVRNLPNGDVEAVFQGDQNQIDQMLGWCRQGPPASRVDSIETDSQPAEPFAGFEVRY